LRVIAEGIEQPRELSALREMGCDYGQGFLIARPMAAGGVEALMRTAEMSTAQTKTAQTKTAEIRPSGDADDEPNEHEPNEPARLGM